MGTWNIGIYANDTASDWAAGVAVSLLEDAQKTIDTPGFGVCDFDLVLPSIDVAVYLSESADAYPYSDFPIREWKLRLLDIFDRESEEIYYNKEDLPKRRNVIEDLFGRAEAIIEEVERVEAERKAQQPDDVPQGEFGPEARAKMAEAMRKRWAEKQGAEGDGPTEDK